jgi:hypothetical protein
VETILNVESILLREKNMKKLLLILLFLPVFIIPAKAQLQSDTSDAVWSIVMPIAESQNIDMMKCLIGNSRDSLVNGFIRNIGTWEFQVDSIYFRGSDASAFELVSGFPQYILSPGKGNYGEFRFRPFQARLYSAEIVIITQADTLYQSIIGEGIQPQLAVISDIIDFGIINIGSQKDSMQAVTIKNIGLSPLTITNTKHNKPNDYDFKTLSGGGSFTLNPGDTCKMDLQFKPSDVGRTSGVLEFYYNGVGSPAVVQLYGEGVNKYPVIETNISSFPDLICENTIDEYILISNNGGNPLIIKAMNIKGTNSDEFSINETLPITIEPDSSKRIAVTFIPKTIGQKYANIEILSNAIPDSISSIPLNAKKERISLTSETHLINLGYLCPNETKDTIITISNTGTLNTGGYATSSTNISLQNNVFNIDAGNNHSINLHFTGLSNLAPFNEMVTIIDSVCGISNNIKITGEIVLPYIDADDITMSTMVGTNKDDKIIIKNKSKRDFTIESINGIIIPFRIIGNPFPILVAVGNTAELPIEYTPNDELNDTIIAIINAEPCSITKSIKISGLPSAASATIKSGNSEGYPGDIIDVPIILQNEKNIQSSGATTLKVEMKFNSTLLFPLDNSYQKIDETTSNITIENLPINKIVGDTLITLRFKVGLGNAESCNLTLYNAKAQNGNLDISLLDGTFKLLGICQEGGKRLINPNGKEVELKIAPNPSDGRVSVELNLIEYGITTLRIYDNIGNIIYEKDLISFTGKKDLIIETSRFANGIYFVILQTPTIRKTKELIIFK